MLGRQVSLRHALYAVLALLGLQAVGIVGFVVIMDENPVDAFYRTVTYVSTVGLDTIPQTAGAKLFSIFLIACGVVLFLYVIGLGIELAVSGVVTGTWQERRFTRAMSRLEGHYVICGYGRVGRRVAEEFRAAGVEYAIVDEAPAALEHAQALGELAVEGDATDDEVLVRAGVDRARGLVACVDSDAENLFIVVSARELRPDLMVVARATTQDAGLKLLRGGATRVLTPYEIAGRELATMLLKPHVSAFLEVVAGAGGLEFQFEQVEVEPGSESSGATIRSLRIRDRTGALVIAHQRPSEGTFNTRPDIDLPLEAGDVLICVGTPLELRALEGLFRSREAVV